MPRKSAAALKNTLKQPDASSAAGLEVGRLILKDQAQAYENLAQGGEGRGLLSDRERLGLVENLKKPEDIRQFNQFRYLHEYLTRASLSFAVHRQTAAACYWRLRYYLRLLAFKRLAPRLVTQKQHQGALPLFPLENQPTAGPLAVLTPESESLLAGHIDGRGYLKDPAEDTDKTDPGQGFPQAVDEYRQAVKEQLVIETAVDIIGRFVGVPEIKAIVGGLDLGELKAVNKILSQAAGLGPSQSGDEAAPKLAAALKPLRLADLAPTEAARKKARRAVSFTTVQGNIEPFYDLLRRKDD